MGKSCTGVEKESGDLSPSNGKSWLAMIPAFRELKRACFEGDPHVTLIQARQNDPTSCKMNLWRNCAGTVINFGFNCGFRSEAGPE